MTRKTNAVKSAPTAARVVNIVKNSVFTPKSRPLIAPTGFLKASYMGAINESGTDENNEEVNRIVVTIEVETPDGKDRFVLTKNYNILPNGRGFTSFLEDYNAWTEAGLTEDDLYNKFDGEKDKGKPLVVAVGHRKVGKEWEAVIEAFHPASYTGATVA